MRVIQVIVMSTIISFPIWFIHMRLWLSTDGTLERAVLFVAAVAIIYKFQGFDPVYKRLTASVSDDLFLVYWATSAAIWFFTMWLVIAP